MSWLATVLARRHWLASTVLPIAIGVVAAVSMTLWVNGDRSAAAYTRFVADEQSPDTLVHLCPRDFVYGESPIHECGLYESGAAAEMAAIEALPEVTSVGRAGWSEAEVEDASGSRGTLPVVAVVDGDYSTRGHPLLVDGALPDPQDAGSIVVQEGIADQMGWAVGDTVLLSPRSFGADPSATPAAVTIAAVTRPSDELVPHDGFAMQFSSLVVGPAWAADHLDSIWASFVIERAPGVSIDELERAMLAAFPDRTMVIEEASESAVESVIREAASDERLALRALALGVAAAGAFFAAQATVRQTRRELDDRHTLEALGVAPRQMVGLVARRWVPSALLAASVAVGLSACLTALGPLGIGRRAPWSAEVSLTPAVAVVGSVATVALLLGAALTAARPLRRTGSPTRTRVLSPLPLPVWTTVAALRPSVNRRSVASLGTAVVGTALAAAAFIAASAVGDTLASVITDPATTGADFDGIVPGSDEERSAAAIAEVATLDGVARASTMIGTTVTIDGTEVWLQAFVPIDGLARVAPVITGGREPVAAGEIALAQLTLDELGLEIGDSVTVEAYVSNFEPWPATIVGTALVNDLWEPSAGRGGTVSADTVAAYFIEEIPDVAVAFTDDAAGVTARAELADRLIESSAPRSVAHVARLDWVPFVLAAIAAVMAAITFVHALYTAVRSQRPDLAAYRVLGLSRPRAIGVVLLESAALSFAALALAIPIGLIVGRWGWELINARLGLATAVELPIRSIVLAVAAVVAVGVVVAVPIGRRATAGSIASALRAE